MEQKGMRSLRVSVPLIAVPWWLIRPRWSFGSCTHTLWLIHTGLLDHGGESLTKSSQSGHPQHVWYSCHRGESFIWLVSYRGIYYYVLPGWFYHLLFLSLPLPHPFSLPVLHHHLHQSLGDLCDNRAQSDILCPCHVISVQFGSYHWRMALTLNLYMRVGFPVRSWDALALLPSGAPGKTGVLQGCLDSLSGTRGSRMTRKNKTEASYSNVIFHSEGTRWRLLPLGAWKPLRQCWDLVQDV